MKKRNGMSTAAILYLLSAIIWLVVAVLNFTKGQPVYGGVYVALVVLCLILAKRKAAEQKK